MSKLGKKLIEAVQMKQGQTFHAITCNCDFCKIGDTRFPIPCQATFKEHCQYPKCDCDRSPKDEIRELSQWIKDNPGKFDGVSEKTQRIKHLVMENPDLDPIQNNCKYGYVLPDRCRYTAYLGCDCGAYPPIKPPVTSEIINSTEFPRLKDIPEEIMDVFDGPEQECFLLTSKEQLSLLKSLEEVEANLNGGYVGGMTEYWNRRREHLLKEIQEIQMRDWNL